MSEAVNSSVRVGLVTGAGRGIGRAIVEALAADGAQVAAFDLEPGQDGAEALRLSGDVRDSKQAERAITRVVDEFGRLDFLVNNAGMRPYAPLSEHDDATWADTLAVNLTGAFNFIRAAEPHFRRAGAGRIVNISSSAATLGSPNRVAYCAAKAGIEGMTRSLAMELASIGVRINAIAPGPIKTEMAAIYDDDEEATRRILASTPSGRWGQPEEVAAAVAFLVGAGSDFINGAVLPVDGGFCAGKFL